MIRANLLPRPKETLEAYGIELDADYLRQAALGLAIVIVVAFLGIGIEQLHVTRLRIAAERLEASVALDAAQRAESKSLALQVARFQEFAREVQLSRRSGPQVAIAVARIGNHVPQRAWLDSLTYSDTGYELSGSASNVEVVSGAILSLGEALPALGASLVSIANQTDGGVRFGAHVGAKPGASRLPSSAR